MVAEKTSSKNKQERSAGQLYLPLARVKKIIKEDPDINLINAEATHCVASATELFIEYLVNEGYARAQKNKRKTIFYKDLATAVSQTDPLEFLEDVIPQTVTLEEAYRRRKQPGDQPSHSNGSAAAAGSSVEPSVKKRKVDQAQEEGEEEEEGTAAVTSNVKSEQEEGEENDEEDDNAEDDENDEEEEEALDEEEEEEEADADEEDEEDE